MTVLLAAEPSARGAPVEELVPATIVAAAMVALVVAVVWAHRRGSTNLLARPSAFVEEKTGLPAWASVPMAMTFASLAVAVFGYYWDVSWHIDRGRDTGAFANPAHWFIILGLGGVALAGVMALTLADDRRTESSVSIAGSWRAPVGGVLLLLCGAVALAGFPLTAGFFSKDEILVSAWSSGSLGQILAILGILLGVLPQLVSPWLIAPAASAARTSMLRIRSNDNVAWLFSFTAGGTFVEGAMKRTRRA